MVDAHLYDAVRDAVAKKAGFDAGDGSTDGGWATALPDDSRMRAATWSRTVATRSAFDADHVPIAHVGREPRIHAHAGVPGDAHRHQGHRAIARDVQLRKRTWQIRAAVGDGGGAGVV